MPRAEVGSTKHISNKMKSKGLQRLRWFCQVCNKQCRDENGFKCHSQSESHVRQMQLVGEDPKKYINQYSNEFKSTFLDLLKTSHGEKSVHANRFYNEFIADKEHIHMNATKWSTLTEFVSYLGREGICRVEETEKGLHIAWVDRSPERLKRAEAIRKRERQDRGDEEREQQAIKEQIARSKEAEKARGAQQNQEQPDTDPLELERTDREKIKLSFVAKGGLPNQLSPPDSQGAETSKDEQLAPRTEEQKSQTVTPPAEEPPAPSVKMSFGSMVPKPKNVFAAAAKKNPLAGKKAAIKEQPKKMSEVERIMKEEMAKKRPANELGAANKKQRVI